MLRFEHGAEFELTGNIKSSSDRLVRISGYTKDRPFTFQVQTGAGFTSNDFAFRIPEMPIAVIVSDDSGIATQNSAYVELNFSVEGTPFMHLCKGHLGPNQPLGWPDSPPLSPMQDKGETVVITTANPGAGSEVSLTTEAQSWLLVHSFACQFVTDATVANRRVQLRATVGGSLVLGLASPADQPASETHIYSWSAGSTSLFDGTGFVQQGGFPVNVLFPPGTVIFTLTTNLQAGDNFSAGVLLVSRFQAA